jgi:hypothetical protein
MIAGGRAGVCLKGFQISADSSFIKLLKLNVRVQTRQTEVCWEVVGALSS